MFKICTNSVENNLLFSNSGATKINQPQITDYLLFYTQCQTSATSNKFVHYFANVDEAFQQLDQGIQYWQLFHCPMTNNVCGGVKKVTIQKVLFSLFLFLSRFPHFVALVWEKLPMSKLISLLILLLILPIKTISHQTFSNRSFTNRCNIFKRIIL